MSSSKVRNLSFCFFNSLVHLVDFVQAPAFPSPLFGALPDVGGLLEQEPAAPDVEQVQRLASEMPRPRWRRSARGARRIRQFGRARRRR